MAQKTRVFAVLFFLGGVSVLSFTNCSEKGSSGSNPPSGKLGETPTPAPTPGVASKKLLWQKYNSSQSAADIWVMNSDGSEKLNLTPNTDSFMDFDGQWSHDHSKIVFTSTRRSSNPDIYIMNADGSGVTALTNNDAFETFGSFSADDKKIVFSRTTTGGCAGVTGQLHTMNTDGSNVVKISTGCDEEPAYSPDGSKIVFDRAISGGYQIYVMNADGTGVTALTNTAGAVENRFPSWSGDGKKLVFASDRSGNFEVYTMNSDGSGLVKITDNPGSMNTDPAWSSDGTKIVFASTRSGSDAEIYIMNPDGTEQTNLSQDNSMFDAGPFGW